MGEIRSQPCSSCPYLRSTPSGVWAPEEYAKLVAYDAPTAEQPFGPFACHATPENLCAGWAVCHTNRGHDHDLIALRIAGVSEVPELDDVPPLWESGLDAAQHGLSEIFDPSPEAQATMARLRRKYPRLDP